MSDFVYFLVSSITGQIMPKRSVTKKKKKLTEVVGS